MLEINNGFLLVYFIVLCIVSYLVAYIVNPVVACIARPSDEDRTIWAEIMQLRAEQKGISMKDEFASYSKLQRKIFKLESQLKNNSENRRHRALAIKSTVNIILQAVLAVLVVASVIWFRREPIVTLKCNLFPFGAILQYPSDVPNAISTHMWVLITNFSVRSLLKPFTS